MISIKKYKHIEDIIEDYLELQDEFAEIPLQHDKIQEKLSRLNEERGSDNVKADDAQDYYKIFAQQHKVEERQRELIEELEEVEILLKGFLKFINGTVEYARKEENEKGKVTYLFRLEEDQIKTNR